jgi:DNA-binding response OmpR family regulator
MGQTPHIASEAFRLIFLDMKESMTSNAKAACGELLHNQTTSPLRILVADDDFDTRQISISILTHSGYEVDAAANGAVAWQTLNTGRYDLLITNHQMPKVSGVELLMKLHAAHSALPVIMASAILPREQFIRYPWLKPAAMLLQPCNVAELLGTVKKILCKNKVVVEQTTPLSIRQGHPSSQWFAAMMILIRRSAFH